MSKAHGLRIKRKNKSSENIRCDDTVSIVSNVAEIPRKSKNTKSKFNSLPSIFRRKKCPSEDESWPQHQSRRRYHPPEDVTPPSPIPAPQLEYKSGTNPGAPPPTQSTATTHSTPNPV